ncbi:Endonuclease YhcR [Microbacterium lemovicicum]|uniref:Endonuclease YhcR n=1 Tax=Microbacterium lemovicicum TaxID=1072463 RepID=A0A3S9W978_9MICO|nr:5'-nucleotidase C-terminal domain-containing protein [Microbacterium lemovicicum]AZS36615.1 Endonuclease YhcR [Microbacterium lemovicicum]
MHSRPSVTSRRSRGLRLGAGAVATIAALGAGLLAAPAAQAADPVTIDLVTVNDFHGRIEASAPAGGIAAIATAVNGIRASNPNTIFAAAGDMIGASTFTSFIQQDTPTIETLNAAGLDVSSVGNHEFDRGWSDLVGRVQPLALWEYLGANVYDRATGQPALPSYYVKDVDGVKVGFIGAVTNELPSLVNPAGIADLDIRDVTTEVNRAAAELTDGTDTGLGDGGVGLAGPDANLEADVIVLLVHEGAATPAVESATDPASPFGRIVNGASPKIDAIVSGHTHLAYNHQIPFEGGQLATRPVISSGQYGEKFSDMKITYDREAGALVSMANTTFDMYTTPAGSTTPVANYAPDGPIAALVQQAVDAAAVPGAKQLGTITADFNRALQPGTDAQGNPANVENRGGESTLGNFVADVQLWSAQRTDASTAVAFMNPGGLRANLTFAPDGVLTYKEAAAVQPFANTLVNVTMTGDQIRQALEQQWQPSTAARPFLKLGVSKSLTYTFDPAAAAGSRITSMTLNGSPVDPTASYRVVVNSFLAAGGDNFPAFAAGTAKTDTGKVDLESMVDYMADAGTVSPDLAQRAVGVSLSAPGPQGYVGGTSLTADLSSLDFTTSETAAGTVSVTIGDAPAVTATIDRTLTVANDLTGRASVTVPVPTGVSGAVPLTITTPSGTSVSLPITVYQEPVVETSPTVTIGYPGKLLVRAGSSLPYTVLVFASGETPTGEVTVYDGSKVVATAVLTEADRGRVKVTVKGLSRGLHLLSATYGGSDTLEPSRGPALPVLVW